MPIPVSDRVWKRREALRDAGLRPVPIWVPDTCRSGFAAECRRQSALIADSDRCDADLSDDRDAALEELEEWW
jgi:hypothetical protein